MLTLPFLFQLNKSQIGTCSHPAAKFLGVLFDQNLNFKTHIQLVKSKISKALFVLRQVKNILSKKALTSIYFATIHCHLIYGINVWGSASKTLLNEIHMKQKQAIRIITNSKYNAHTEPLFKESKILPLPDLIHFSKLQFMHNFKHHLLPTSFTNMWTPRQASRNEAHHQELRQSEEYSIATAKTQLVARLPLINFPTVWNNFKHEEIKLLSKKSSFNIVLKKYLLSQLSSIPVCNRDNCPNCKL